MISSRGGPHPFASEVVDGMRRRGLSLRKLCRLSGLDPSYFSKVLLGKRNPPSDEDALRRLAHALSLDARWLIVCAGRIPQEWGRLSRDKDVFSRVSGVLTGRAVPPEAAAPNRGHRPAPFPPRRRSAPQSVLSEELL